MKMTDLKQFIRQDLIKFEEYKAVPSAYDIALDNNLAINEIDKLDANENVFGPSSKLNRELARFKGYQYYPDPEYKRLRRAIGNYVNVPEDYILVGSGGDELIDLLLRLIIEPGDEVINSPPTFGSYSTSTILNRGILVDVPRKKGFGINTKKVLRSINSKTKLIILCNPNNPSGNITDKKDIEQILKAGRLVLVDEAYFEFSKQTTLPLIKKYPNLIILRTFSKWAGIAGLRLGYLIASPIFIRQLTKIKSPYNINVAAEIGGMIALDDINYQQSIIEEIIKERKRLLRNLSRNINLLVYPSFANFIFLQVKDFAFPKLKLLFQKNIIAVRSYDSTLTGKAFRITIGSPQQNKKILEILDNI
ncbi:histidinol-phosphate transaminase [Candidatus Roizmanbacteria bacterium]|nr:histidinol-phosphate transaminase [Candidatus Roizmanbacteria bacterium]